MARTKQRGARRVEKVVEPLSSRPMDVDQPAPSSGADGRPGAASQIVDRVTVTLDDHRNVAADNPNVKVAVFAVDFPGYVSGTGSSTARAMRTLGGLEGIQDQRQAHPKQLKVKLRPDDPYCHPVIGATKKSTNVILLRLAYDTPGNMEGIENEDGFEGADDAVGARGEEGRDDGNELHEPPVVIEATSSAILVDELYSFKQPADLQLDSLTKMNKVAGVTPGARADGNVAPGSQTVDTMAAGAAAPDVRGERGNLTLPIQRQKLACVPAVFFVEGTAEYNVDTYGVGRESGVPSYLTMRGNNEIIVDYGVTNLAQLAKDDGGYYEPSFKDTDSRLSSVGHALRKIFLERPVYAGAPLALAVTSKMNNTVFSDTDANAQLSKLCYRFSSGPWRGCWVRKGYDPRKESQAGKYQVVTLLKREGSNDGGGVTGRGTGGNNVVWSNADDYNALCSLDAAQISQYPARIQMMDIKDEAVLVRLKQGSAKQCHRETGWQTASEMTHLCERISTVLGDAGVRASEWEADDVPMLPFSTIRSFGTNDAPILAASKKRGDDKQVDNHENDRPDGQLFDILPEEYHAAIQKMGLETKPK